MKKFNPNAKVLLQAILVIFFLIVPFSSAQVFGFAVSPHQGKSEAMKISLENEQHSGEDHEAQEAVRINSNYQSTLGSGSVVENFIAVEGLPLGYGSTDFEMDAFKAIGMKTKSYNFFQDPSNPDDPKEILYGFHVIRGGRCHNNPNVLPVPGNVEGNAENNLCIDPKGMDTYIKWIMANHGLAKPPDTFEVGIPRVLSLHPESPEYLCYAPASYDEWTQVNKVALAYLKNHWNIHTINAIILGEPENLYRGEDKEFHDPDIMKDYVKLYVASYRAMKEVYGDQGFVMGPTTGVYSSELARKVSGMDKRPGMDEFVAELNEYNQSHPAEEPVVPKKISWQGYRWDRDQDGRLESGVEFVNALLKQYNFPPVKHQIYGWHDQSCGEEQLGEGEAVGKGSEVKASKTPDPNSPAHLACHASYFAANAFEQMIRYLKTGGIGSIEKAYYYTWNWGGVHFSLVETGPHQGIPESEIPASDRTTKKPVYAAMELLNKLRKQKVIESNVNNAPSNGLLQVFATRTPEGAISQLIANGDKKPYQVQLRISNVPWPAGSEIRSFRRAIDKDSSNVDGNNGEGGLEALQPYGTHKVLRSVNGTNYIEVPELTVEAPSVVQWVFQAENAQP